LTTPLPSLNLGSRTPFLSHADPRQSTPLQCLQLCRGTVLVSFASHTTLFSSHLLPR
jgi:hypothetical protein